MDQGIASFASGLSDSISAYLGQQTQSNLQTKQQQDQANIEQQKEINVAKAKQDMQPQAPAEPQMNPDMAEKILPGSGGNMVSAFQKQNGRLPTMNEAKDYLKQAIDQIPDTSKNDNHQDQLEGKAQTMLTQVRGDASLLKTEAQRDASAMAYETIAKAQSEGRHLSSVEYNDLAAQLWKARTGSSVTTEELKKLAPTTAQTSADHLAAWASGNPNMIGSTSADTENNLKQFIVSSGQMADKQHEAYMAPRLIKPTGLEQSRWDRLHAASRGLTFGEQKQVSDTTHAVKGPSLADKKAALRAKLGI